MGRNNDDASTIASNQNPTAASLSRRSWFASAPLRTLARRTGEASHQAASELRPVDQENTENRPDTMTDRSPSLQEADARGLAWG